MKTHTSVPQTKKTIEALWRLEKIILDTLDFNQVVQRICDGLLSELGYLDLGYKIIVLTLVDEKNDVLKRIALSQTREAKKAQEVSAVPFHQIDIPMSASDNLLIKTIKSGRPGSTKDWKNLFSPILSADQARNNQNAAEITSSMVYPIRLREENIGAVIFSMTKEETEVTEEEKDLLRGFCDIIGLAVQNARLYTEIETKSTELKRANKKLKELDRIKDEFLSIASHELRTPMTAIKSYLWMALSGKGGKLSDKQHYYLERSYKSTDRLIKLVNNMLNVSRIESGRLKFEYSVFCLRSLCAEVFEELQPRADELELHFKLLIEENEHCSNDPEKFEVEADQEKIREVITNLIGNSLKFTPKGGSITISLKKDKNFVVTTVTDTGVGLDQDGLSKLFNKFSLMKDSYRIEGQNTQGTGLGLYICKSIIELHQGKIVAESKGKDKGLTISFSLPRPKLTNFGD